MSPVLQVGSVPAEPSGKPRSLRACEERVLFQSLAQAGTAADYMASATWDSPVGLSKTWWAHLCDTSGHPRAPIWVPILLPGADSSYMYTSHPITQIGPDKSYFLRYPLPARMLILDPTLEISSSPLETGSHLSPLSNFLCYSAISLILFSMLQNPKILSTRRRSTMGMSGIFSYLFIHQTFTKYIYSRHYIR